MGPFVDGGRSPERGLQLLAEPPSACPEIHTGRGSDRPNLLASLETEIKGIWGSSDSRLLIPF